MPSEENSQLADLLSITHFSALSGIDSAPLICTRKTGSSRTGGGGETLREEQPGERGDEGESGCEGRTSKNSSSSKQGIHLNEQGAYL